MAEQEIPDDLLQKIKRLLAMANQQDSPHEAEIAAKVVQGLLMKHNLDISQIENLGEKKNPSITHERVSETDSAMRNESTWIPNLYAVISENYLCKTLQRKLPGSKNAYIITIIGVKVNVEVVKFTVEALIPRIRNFARESYKNYTGHEKKNTYIRGYLVGVVAGIAYKLQEEKVKLTNEYTGMSGLIKVNDTSINSYMDDNFRIGKGKADKRKSGSNGMHHGYEKGKTINISKPMEGGRNSSLTLGPGKS